MTNIACGLWCVVQDQAHPGEGHVVAHRLLLRQRGTTIHISHSEHTSLLNGHALLRAVPTMMLPAMSPHLKPSNACVPVPPPPPQAGGLINFGKHTIETAMAKVDATASGTTTAEE